MQEKENKLRIKQKLSSLSKQERKLRKVRAKRQKSNAPKVSVQKSIWYDLLFEKGLCQIDNQHFSKTYHLEEVNYQTANRDDQIHIFSKMGEMLNALDEDNHLQYTIINKAVDMEKFKEQHYMTDEHDGFDDYRHEINRLMDTAIHKGSMNFIPEKYVTVTAKAEDRKQAEVILSRVESSMYQSFSQFDSNINSLDGTQRLKVFHHILRPHDLFDFNYQDLLFSGLSTKSGIAPMYLNFHSRRLKKSGQRFDIGTDCGQVLFLRSYESDFGDTLIRDLLELPQEMVISYHIQPINNIDSKKKAKYKLSAIEGRMGSEQSKNIRKQMSPELISRQLKDMHEEAVEIVNAMDKENQKYFQTIFLVYVHAEDEDILEDRVQRIIQVGKKNNVNFSKLEFMQEQALNSVLPIGKNYVDAELIRNLMTVEVAVNTPFTSQDLTHVTGKYYGVNRRTKNMINVDRSKLYTASGLILGTSGSGKGVSAKYEIVTTYLQKPDDEIIVVDPESEYGLICEAFGGQNIEISASTNNYVNLMELPDDDDLDSGDDSVKLKSDFLITLFGTLIGEQGALNPKEETIIDRVTTLTYQRTKGIPTLQDWFDILLEQKEEAAKDLATALELYITGSLNIFAKDTNVELTNRLIVFNVNKLKNKLKSFGLMVVFDQIWNRIVQNKKKGITTWVYFDELQLMFSDEYASNFFFELWSRVRKYGAIPTGITQNVSTLLMNPDGIRMIANSEFVIALKQAPDDLGNLVNILGISPTLQSELRYPEKGAGLIKAGKFVVPFSNTIPNDLKLYYLLATDPKQVTDSDKTKH